MLLPAVIDGGQSDGPISGSGYFIARAGVMRSLATKVL